MSYAGSGNHADTWPGKGSQFMVLPIAEYSPQSWLPKKPDQKIQETMEPILWSHLGGEPIHQYYQTVHNQWHPPPQLQSSGCILTKT